MSDIKSYDSISSLQEDIDNLNDLMKDYQQQQRGMDTERSVFFEQLQGDIAIYENRVHQYEEKRDEIDTRQAKLIEDKQACQQNLDILQHQLDAKMGVPLLKGNTEGLPNASVTKETSEAKQEKANNQDRPDSQTLREEIEKLEAQRDKPKLELDMEPPGMGQASRVGQDLGSLVSQKKDQLSRTEASEDLQKNWSSTKGRKQ